MLPPGVRSLACGYLSKPLNPNDLYVVCSHGISMRPLLDARSDPCYQHFAAQISHLAGRLPSDVASATTISILELANGRDLLLELLWTRRVPGPASCNSNAIPQWDAWPFPNRRPMPVRRQRSTAGLELTGVFPLLAISLRPCNDQSEHARLTGPCSNLVRDREHWICNVILVGAACSG